MRSITFGHPEKHYPTWIALLLLASAATEARDLRTASLFVMTDETTGNRVVAYHRDADGILVEAGRYASGGVGLGLGQNLFFAQQSLVISGDYLLVPNSGSNTISTMRIHADRLELIDTEASLGLHPFGFSSVRPISTLGLEETSPELIRPNNDFGQGVFYVTNLLSGNVVGFELRADGDILPLQNPSHIVGGSLISRISQADFTPDGRHLVVTESAYGIGRLINSFEVGPQGELGRNTLSRTESTEPFGFVWDRNHHLLLTEGNTALPGLGAVSSYQVLEDGRVESISPNVQNGQNTTCWIQYTDRTQVPFAYVQGVFGNISSYTVDRDTGTLTLADPRAGITGAGGTVTLSGLDLLITDNRDVFGDDRQYLYALHALNGIVAYRIESDGRLTAIPQAGVPGVLSPTFGSGAVFPGNAERAVGEPGFGTGLLNGLDGYGPAGTGGLPVDPVGLVGGINHSIGIEPLLTEVITPPLTDIYTGPLNPVLDILADATVPASRLAGAAADAAGTLLAPLAALNLPLAGLPAVSSTGLPFSATGLAGR